MNKFIDPPCNNFEATSFIMPDEKRKKVNIFVGDESSRHVDGSGAAPVVGVRLVDQFPPAIPFVLFEGGENF